MQARWADDASRVARLGGAALIRASVSTGIAVWNETCADEFGRDSE